MFKAAPYENMFLKYTFNDKKELSYIFLKSLSPISSNAVANADDLIRAWASVAKEALEGEQKEQKKVFGLSTFFVL